MKKNILILIILFTTSWTYAQTNTPFLRSTKLLPEKKEWKKQIIKPEIPQQPQVEKERIAYLEKIKALRNHNMQKEENEKKEFSGILKTKAANGETVLRARIDSLVYVYPDGTNYTKEVFTFDEEYYDTSYTAWVWNTNTNEWVKTTWDNYEWDENRNNTVSERYMLDDWSGSVIGERHEFKYDANGRVIEEIVIQSENDVPFETTKRVYTLDEQGNVLEDYLHILNGSQWEVQQKAILEYDSKNRATFHEEYTWNGSSWDGLVQEFYRYDDDVHQTYFEDKQWNPETREWVNYHRFEHKYENGLLVEQSETFWSTEHQDWVGYYWGDVLEIPNWKTIFTYDEEGKLKSELYSKFINNKWNKDTEMEITHTPKENDTIRYERKTYSYFDRTSPEIKIYNDEREYWSTLIIDYFIANFPSHVDDYADKIPKNAASIYAFESNVDMGGELYEDHYAYDEVGNETYYAYYVWTVSGDKVGEIKNEFEYDENFLVALQISYIGQGTSDNDWIPFTKFTYAHENGARTEKMKYVYNNGEWYPGDMGEKWEFDFNVPLEQLVVFAGYPHNYKMLYYYQYEGVGSDWDKFTRTYYWAPLAYVIDLVAESGTINGDEQLTGLNLTLPTATPDPKCTEKGWTFAGWATVNENITSAMLIPAGEFAPTADMTLYAVFTDGETLATDPDCSEQGLEEVENSAFSIYPNPVSDIIYINSTEEVEVNIYNMQGIRLVQTTEKQIDMAKYASGIYIVEVNGVRKNIVKK